VAYLRVLRADDREYYYIVKSRRSGKRVISKVLEYLGRDPDPARLRKALDYWGVKARPGTGKSRR
jgi:hypothetical protein